MEKQELQSRVRLAFVDDDEAKPGTTDHLGAFVPFESADDEDFRLLGIYDLLLDDAKFGRVTSRLWNCIGTDRGMLILDRITVVPHAMKPPLLQSVTGTWIDAYSWKRVTLKMNQVL